MATRTISDLGGNYNATTTWVEGVVPTSADDVVATATSGQLTVNVSSAARSIDLTLYTNTLTFNNNLTFNAGGLTHTFGAGMDFASTNPLAKIVFSQPATLVQNTTNRIPGLRFGGFGVRTLSTDIYCNNFDISNIIEMNDNVLYSSGDFGSYTSVNSNTLWGTSKVVLDGSGIITQCFNLEVEINTVGTYSTRTIGLMLNSATSTAYPIPKLNIVAGNLNPDAFNVTLYKHSLGTQQCILQTSVKIPNLFIHNRTVNGSIASYRNLYVTVIGDLIVENLSTWNVSRYGTSDNALPVVSIFGGGLSASNVYLTPASRQNSSTSIFETTSKSIDLRLNSDATHKIGNLMVVGGFTDDRPTISSITASVPCTINLANKEGSQIINYDFTDVIAGEDEIVAINATLTGTTNITNVYPSGGGSSGGAWTFVS